MSSYVKYKDKKSGTVYVYESESYWDKEKKQPRNRRKLIGKIDEETGEIVPTAGHKRKKQDPETSSGPASKSSQDALEKKYVNLLQQQEAKISQLEKENQELKEAREGLLQGISDVLKQYKSPKH